MNGTHSMRPARARRGYTLIELIISVGIFSMIMLLATGAYLSLVSYTRYARATSLVMTNLSFAIDGMARDLRTGSHYACPGGDSTDGTCKQISFMDDQGHSVVYMLDDKKLKRCVDAAICTTSVAVTVTDPALEVTSLAFYVRGSTVGDTVQPTVVAVVQGRAYPGKGAAPVSFSVETSATQRLIDL